MKKGKAVQMPNRPPGLSDRRAVLRTLVGLATVPAGLSVGYTFGVAGIQLISPAHAIGLHGMRAGQGDVIHIPGASAPSAMIAEWVQFDPKNGYPSFGIAATQESFAKAPASAARCEAKLYNFPTGSMRTLTYKAGGPVLHMITYETGIYVLSGIATLIPLAGHPGKPVTVRAGDALFLPSGYLSSPKASEDFVILQAFVSRGVQEAKKGIITTKEAGAIEAAEWQVDGKEFRLDGLAELRKAPKGAHRISSRRHIFDGLTFYAVTLSGGRSNVDIRGGMDILMYIAKGRVRRTQGNQSIELVAGDCTRQSAGQPDFWEPHEETLFIAVRAPKSAGMLPPAAA